MKIGIDIRPLMDREYSGVSWYALDLLTAIFQQDKINEYCLYYNSGRDISARMPKFEQGNVRIISTSFPNKLFNYFLQNILGWPKLDKIVPSIKRGGPASAGTGCVDIFWLPHLNFASFSKKCRKILTIHDLSFLVFPEFFSWRKNFWHKMLNVKKQVLAADRIVAISENTKNDIIKFFNAPADKISVIYSGVGNEFRPWRRDLKAETALEPKNNIEALEKIKVKYGLPEKFILNIGTIEPRKNIVGLVQAFDLTMEDPNAKDYYLVIVGAGGWKNKEIYNAISLAKHKDKIKVIGYIEKSERVYFYNLAAIFCYPSFYEGFGLPILEAMASGAPVITSAVSALPEVAGDAALYVDPNDIATISKAMLQLITDPGLSRQMAERGFAQAKKFSWPKTAENYIRIFNQE